MTAWQVFLIVYDKHVGETLITNCLIKFPLILIKYGSLICYILIGYFFGFISFNLSPISIEESSTWAICFPSGIDSLKAWSGRIVTNIFRFLTAPTSLRQTGPAVAVAGRKHQKWNKSEHSLTEAQSPLTRNPNKQLPSLSHLSNRKWLCVKQWGCCFYGHNNRKNNKKFFS